MKRNKWLVAGMSLCLAVSTLLTGCGGNKTKKSSVKLDSGKMEADSVVMGVGDEAVRYSEMMNYAYLLKRQYEGNFGSELWGYTVGENKTVGDQAKQEIINMVTQLKVIQVTAKQQKVSLSNDEKDEALQQAEKIMENVSEEEKQTFFLTIQGMSQLYEENILANKMFYVATDDADTEVSDEDAKQVFIQYLQVLTKGRDSSGKQIDMDAAGIEQARKRGEALQKEAVKTKDFLGLAKENSDAPKQELVIGKDSEELEKAAVDVALSLRKGQVSGLIEGEQGFYVIHCVNDNDVDATQNRKEEIIEERQTAMFKKKYNSWLKKCEVNISEDFWENFQL
ncbi:MAG: peptidylprolyl isomerase [Lachnospiraceae bacterium]|nr:peptidylprolyl isomerase [Lachnospiraceae bacterium]